MWRSHILFYFRRFILFLSRSVIASRFSSTGPSSEKLLSIRATASRAKLMCWAICSWVCCSKSTSRMTSYSSGVSRIGSVFSPPGGAKCLDLWCATNPTAPWRSWHGRFSPSVFSIYQIIALYAGKSNILFKSCYNFCPHIDAGWYSESKATCKP